LQETQAGSVGRQGIWVIGEKVAREGGFGGKEGIWDKVRLYGNLGVGEMAPWEKDWYWGIDAEQETMNYLEFIARVTSHIPDKGQVMVRYYGLYANAHIHRSSQTDVHGG